MEQWIEVELIGPQALMDPAASFLFDEGASGVETKEELDSRASLQAYFRAPYTARGLIRFCIDLAATPEGLVDFTVQIRPVIEQDWAEIWKSQTTAIAVGDRLWVHPPWIPDCPADRVSIEIDPGMAFGTGHHATTRSCLRLIDTLVRERAIRSAIDVGCGSGILAIAIARLSEARVIAIDNDPVALENARRNLTANNVAEQIALTTDTPADDTGADLIVANLFTNLLETMAADFQRWLGEDGTLICSGFLTSDAARVNAAMSAQGLSPIARLDDEGWVALAFRRSSSD